MYFEEAPKRAKKDFYNYAEQLNSLVTGLKSGTRLTVVEGLRRTGKTSLILTGLKLTDLPSLLIDARTFPETPVITKREFLESMQRSLNEFLRENKGWWKRFAEAIGHVRGVEIQLGKPPTVRLSWGGRDAEAVDLTALFKTLGETAESKDKHFVIFLDEAQEFSRLRGYNLLLLLGHIYDYIPGVELVLTGSAVGLLHNFLRIDDPKSPLFGRALKTINLSPLANTSSKEFLRKGFQQLKMTIPPKTVDEVADRLDGIVGWLTYYGVQAKFHHKVNPGILEATITQGARLAAAEFQHFLLLRQIARRRYLNLMRQIAKEPQRWSELKRTLENEEGRSINDKVLRSFLVSLRNASFITKWGQAYSVTDPLLKEALRLRLLKP